MQVSIYSRLDPSASKPSDAAETRILWSGSLEPSPTERTRLIMPGIRHAVVKLQTTCAIAKLNGFVTTPVLKE